MAQAAKGHSKSRFGKPWLTRSQRIFAGAYASVTESPKRLAMALAFIALVVPVRADTIHLTDGRTFTNCTATRKGEKYFVTYGSVHLTLSANLVESVEPGAVKPSTEVTPKTQIQTPTSQPVTHEIDRKPRASSPIQGPRPPTPTDNPLTRASRTNVGSSQKNAPAPVRAQDLDVKVTVQMNDGSLDGQAISEPRVLSPVAPAPLPLSEPTAQQPRLRYKSRSGRLTVEDLNSFIAEQLLQKTGARDMPRQKSFNPGDWTDGKQLVRVEQDDVPVFGGREPNLNASQFQLVGIAKKGEILAFVQQYPIVSLMNPLSNIPDQSGLWYKVGLVSGEQGWLFANPQGHHGPPFARAFTGRNGQLVELQGERPQTARSASEAMSNAYAQGSKTGYEAGMKHGDSAGFAEASKAAERESFDQTITTLYASGKYNLVQSFCVAVALVSSLAGFGLQFMVMSWIRKSGVLRDIDWIVLGKYAKGPILSPIALLPSGPEQDQASRDRKFTLPLLLVFFSLMLGCQNEEKEAWKKGYDTSYQAGYQAGQQPGRVRGVNVGMERGAAEAKEAAQNGRAWQLYTDLAIKWLLWGSVIGFLIQYVVLLSCRFSRRLHRLLHAIASQDPKWPLECSGPGAYAQLTRTLVPGMRMSRSHSIFEQSQRCIAEIDELLLTGERQITKIRVIVDQMDNIREKVTEGKDKANLLHQLVMEHQPAVMEAELEKILADARAEASRRVSRAGRSSPQSPGRSRFNPGTPRTRRHG